MKKKMLIINDLLVGGGVEKLCYDFIMRWHTTYDITFLICAETKEKHFYSIFPRDVHFETLHWYRHFRFDKVMKPIYGALVKFTREITYKKLNQQKFDVLLAMKEGKVMELVGKKLDAGVKLAWVHTDYKAYYYTHYIFGNAQNELKCMKKFDRLVCVSQQIETSIKEVIGDPGNLTVCYNPISREEVMEKASEEITDVDTKKDTVKFVTVGRLNYQKGYGLLLEACHMLDKDGLDYEVWLVGGKEPDDQEALHLEMSQKRLKTDRVKFLGKKENPYPYMKHADWFVSSSLFEGYSLVSQEAAILGLPVLATDCSGVKELLGENDEYGIVTEISVWGIYHGMKRVIENKELQAHYKQQIIQRSNIIGADHRFQEIEKLFN